MIFILKQDCTKEQELAVTHAVESKGLKVNPVYGENQTILGLIGDIHGLNLETLSNFDGVAQVMRVSTPYKKVGRMFHPDDTVIDVAGVKIGAGNFAVMAGPCSVEGEEQIVEVAKQVKAAGANILRGGAYKPRTSPYSFQGMKLEGLKLLAKAREATGLPVVTEAMSLESLELVAQYADMVQMGARNMQNFELLKAAGQIDKPVLLKRGLSATVEELLMAAEYITSEGTDKIVLCERGIRTFETATRNTLDISAVPVLKELSHLPVIVDPSHATGKWALVEPMAKCAVSAGADGLMIEVHNDPAHALSDGEESLKPEKFAALMQSIRPLMELEHKVMG